MTNPRLFDRNIIRISPSDDGEDVRDFLQGLITQDTKLVAPDAPLWSALLTPQGKVLFDFMLFADENAPFDILIDAQASQADALIKRLSIYRLRRKITIAVDENLGVYWSNEKQGTPDPRLAEIGARWIGKVNQDDHDVSDAYRQHRLSLGVAEGIEEFGNGQILWLECNAIDLNGVSFTKGCYVGQENTARMNWRAKINRRIAILPIDQSDEKRQIIAYPDLSLSLEHRRVDDLKSLNLPSWQMSAINAGDDAQ